MSECIIPNCRKFAPASEPFCKEHRRMEKTNMTDFKRLQSHEALVCRKEVHSSAGGATIYYVLLSDGFLVDCGHSEKRAQVLADIINEGGAERLGKGGLR